MNLMILHTPLKSFENKEKFVVILFFRYFYFTKFLNESRAGWCKNLLSDFIRIPTHRRMFSRSLNSASIRKRMASCDAGPWSALEKPIFFVLLKLLSLFQSLFSSKSIILECSILYFSNRRWIGILDHTKLHFCHEFITNWSL